MFLFASCLAGYEKETQEKREFVKWKKEKEIDIG